MIQKDSLHSGFSPQGPASPLKKAWSATSSSKESSFTTWPVVSDGVAFARSGPGVVAVETKTGKQRWFVRPDEGSTIVAPAVHDSALHIPVPFGKMLTLDAKTGAKLWNFQAASDIGASPTLGDGQLYFGAEEARKFYAVSSSSGELLWETPLKLEPDSVPAVASNLVVLTSQDIDSEAALVVALERSTGKEVWQVPQRLGITSPSILEDKVVLGGGDLFAYGLDLETGKQLWKSKVEGRFDTHSAPAIAYGDVFLADRIGNVYRLDGKTGKRKWIFGDANGLDVGGFDDSSPVIAGKTLYIGNGAGWLYGLDVDSGALLWKTQVGGYIYSGAADAERFYFGVKFRNEGLYAYEHDPKGKLEPSPAQQSRTVSLFGILLVAAVALLIFVAVKGKRKGTN